MGRDLPPGSREYMYVRDADYVSANGMLVNRESWEDVGGFADDYHPAYYEDVDLCMALRRRGRRVVYEPRAVLRHREGGSSTTALPVVPDGPPAEGVPRQVGQRPGWPGTISRGRSGGGHRTGVAPCQGPSAARALLDDALPDPGLGSGFARAALAIEDLVASGYAVTLRPFDAAIGDQRHTLARTGVLDRLADLGVNVRYERLGPMLERPGAGFDVILCSRPRSYGEVMPHLRRLRIHAPIVYDTEAIWHRGVEREARLIDDADRATELLSQAKEIRDTEIDAILHADHVVAVSGEEAAIISRMRAEAGVRDGSVSVIGGASQTSLPGPAGWEERCNLLFPAGWLAGASSPNLTSLRYLVDAILPRVVEEVPWIRVLVTGGNPPEEALELAGPNLQFLGYVPDMQVILNTVRAVVVPTLTGAGLKLKIVEAMLAGVPTVSTTVGAEGIDTGATGGLVVTDDPEQFARSLLALHEDPVAWAAERSRVEAFCTAHDSQSEVGWSSLLETVIHDGRLRSVPDEYHQWLLATQPPQSELSEQRAASIGWKYRPTISVCIPVYNPEPGWLEDAVASVKTQTYNQLELCLADDCSSDPAVTALLERLAAEDPRVRTMRRAVNGGISAATNDALALATGEFVAFLDQDDLIAPQAFHRVVAHLQDHPDTDLFYCDEDLLSPDGRRCEPFLKPGWSPETLLSFNYITHLVLARRELVAEVGGLRPQYDGAQDHDLVLRLSERTEAIHHIDDVLYTWRQSPTSTALHASAKPTAHDATVAAVADALRRRGIAGAVTRGSFGGGVVVRYDPPHPAPTTVILTTHGPADRLGAALTALDRVAGGTVDVVVAVAKGAVPADALRKMEGPARRVLEVPGRPKRAELLAAAASSSGAEYLLTLDAKVVVCGDGWLDTLLGLCASPEVGAVGVRMVGSQGRPWHEGIAVGSFGAARITSGEDDLVAVRLGALLRSTRDVSAVSGLCAMVDRVAWDKVGGWDPSVTDASADLDFCLRLGRAGYRVVYTPEVSATLLGPVVDVDCIEPLDPDPYLSAHLVPGQPGWRLGGEEVADSNTSGPRSAAAGN